MLKLNNFLTKLFRFKFNNVKNDNKNNMNNIIKTGHYQSKGSINSETKSIIRVIGESEIPGMWNLSDKNSDNTNKKISEYDLLNNYIFLETSITKETSKVINNNLFDGLDFGEIDEVGNIDDFEDEQVNNYEIEDIVFKYDESKQFQKIIVDNTPKFTEEELFIKSILSKVESTKPTSLKIEIDLSINYNLQKLISTIDLLNLDKNLVSSFIVKKYLSESNVGTSFISKLIENELRKLFDDTEEIKVDVVQQKVSEEPSINIENQLNSIMNKLDNFYGSK